MRKIYMRICAVILIFIMAFSFLPTSAFAEEKPLYDISKELYFGRNKLSKMQNGENLVAAYDAMGRAVKSGNTIFSLNDYKISKEDLKLLFEVYNKDHPEDYCFPKRYEASMLPDGNKLYIDNVSLEYYTGYDKYRFNRMANRFLDAVSGAKTEYEKALMLYNILAQHVQYDNDAVYAYSEDGYVLDKEGIKAFNAYGAIVNGKAVCEGYAEAYQYLLQRAGIQCFIVTGEAKTGGSHEWNLIRLDGKYYHTDLTWDDCNLANKLLHRYFNVTTEMISEDHIIDDEYGILPYCTDTEAFYKYDNILSQMDVDKITKAFKGDDIKIANIYYTGEPFDFNDWWKNNGQALANKIGCGVSVVSNGREYIFEARPSDYNVTVGGMLLSWGDAQKDSAKIELFELAEDTPSYTVYLNGNVDFWTINNVKNGIYKVKVSKQDHKTKEYRIFVNNNDVELNENIYFLGDVNEDGIVDLRDVARAKLCLANGVNADSCDVDQNGSIDAYDLMEVIKKVL